MLTRRTFLRASAAGFALAACPLPGRLARAATSRDVLVALYLRGGADGLSLIVPHGDPEYATLRPTLALPESELIPMTGFFGMNGNFGELASLYASGQMAAIHCVGSTDDTRSHFDAQDYMERAAPGDKSVSDGWLNRYLALAGEGNVLAGISLGWSDEESLAGPAANLSLSSLSEFRFQGSFPEERKAAIRALHAAHPQSLLSMRTEEALAVEETLSSVSTDTNVTYPQGGLGYRLRDLAALIRADVGVHVAGLSMGGWDHHDAEIEQLGPATSNLSACLGAFYQDLGVDANRVLTLVMTEFGRTVQENGTFGSDHGRGSIMLALGGGVSGGNLLLKDGVWPGLAQNPSGPRRDLEVTTDFRDVFAEVLNRHLGVSMADLGGIFPSFAPDANNFPGLFSA
ncbi:MAG: DUF1501 domain-containing protein [Myxococcales bacterium]|nr:DUF1501 domain-containing protein [Myxococcales bacterium]